MNICTIIAKNYVAYARVLARSFAEHDPDGRCFVLVIDEFDSYLQADDEPFTILTPEDIGCREFPDMLLRYDVLELSTAVKPWLLSYLLRNEGSTITYLDPDIWVHSSLESLDELVDLHGMVLTPHNTEPIPDDGKRPNQMDILRAGVYNLGYVSLAARNEIFALLTWWERRLLNDCRVDPLNGYFVDQRWFDLAPGLVSDCAIVREPQYNLAYWNLYSRRLGHDGEHYTVDGQPLAFIHFSGFDPQMPDVLSRHQSRVAVANDAILARICREYADELIAADHLEATTWPYTYDMLPSGIRFDRGVRRLYEAAIDSGEIAGSPYTPQGCDSFMSWLSAPAPGAPKGVNRLLAEMYGTREDLKREFPDVAGTDRERFLQWAHEFGVVDEPALAVLDRVGVTFAAANGASASTTNAGTSHPPSADTPTADAQQWKARAEGYSVEHTLSVKRSPTASWGVNVVGYFRSELGVGEAARQVVNALDAQQVPLLPLHGRVIPPNRQGHLFTYLDFTQAHFPTNLICMNADMLGDFAAQAGDNFFRGRYSIGMWFWEVERFPSAWSSAFEHVDELWLPTDHVVRAVSPLSPIPIVKVTLPVEMPPIVPRGRLELNLPEDFLFLFSFDHHSVFARKNPLAVIDAYTRAFGPSDGAALVIRSINAASAPRAHAELLAAARKRSDVNVIDGYLSPEDKDSTIAACDCYVSLHRAEGFGLMMAEAMYTGKPVIATGYSGNLDFMTPENSYLVDYRLVPIGPGAPPYPADGDWAEPNVDQAAELMRDVFDHQDRSSKRGQRGADDIRRTHSAAAAGAIMARRLEYLRDRDTLLPSVWHNSGLNPQQQQLVQRAQAGPLTHARSPLGPPGKLLRRAVLRALKPYTAYQQGFNADIARSLTSLDSQADNHDALIAEHHAALLAELRSHVRSLPSAAALDSLTRSLHELASYVSSVDKITIGLQDAIAQMPELAQHLQELSHRFQGLDQSVRRIERENEATPYMNGPPFAVGRHPIAGIVQGYANSSGPSEHPYRSFEDTFRGSEEFIRERQRPFLEVLDGREPVLDLGCGRGEFLDLLRDAGLSYLGVDLDAGMAARSLEKGHEVVHGDGLEFLDSLDDQSLGAIFTAQVIEHLPYEQLLRLLVLAHAKLRDDGLFIAETVNPHSVAALKTFWVDLTHMRPIFPEVALALCRDAGFASAYVFHAGASGNFERDRYTEGAYAIVANRSEPVEALLK